MSQLVTREASLHVSLYPFSLLLNASAISSDVPYRNLHEVTVPSPRNSISAEIFCCVTSNLSHLIQRDTGSPAQKVPLPFYKQVTVNSTQ